MGWGQNGSMATGARFVGRTAELAELTAVLRRPTVAVLVVTGEAGIGKSALLSAAVADVEGEGVLMLRCRPTEADRRAPFAALGDLLAPVVEHLDSLPAVQRDALAGALLLEPPTGPADEHTVAAALLTLLRRLSSATRLVAVIDDAHWLDPPSAAAIGWAARRLGADQAVFVVATRQDDASSFPRTALPPDSEAVTVHLRPLAVEEIGALLRDRLSFEPGRLDVGRIHRRSAGNPLWALELARVVQASGVPDAARASLEGLVVDRLAVLPARHEHLLLAVALARVPTPRTVVRGADGDDDDLRLFTDDPGVRGFVTVQDGLVRFEHPVFADVVQARADAITLRRTHQLLADCDAADARLWHLALAAVEHDELLADELEAAAVDAAARGAVETAIELAELAERLTAPASAARHRRMLRRAEWAYQLGAFDVSARLVEELRGQPSAPDCSLLWARLGEISSEAEMLRRLDEGLADPELPPLTRAEALLMRAAAVSEPVEALRDADAASALMASHEPDPALSARAAVLRAHLGLLSGRADHLELMRTAAGATAPDDRTSVVTSARFSLMQHLIALDELAEARQLGRTLLRAARDAGDEVSVIGALQQLGHLETRAGQWASADAHAEEALALARVAADRATEAVLTVHLATTEGLRGHTEQARELLDAALGVADEQGIVFVRAIALASWGRAMMAAKYAAAAAAAFADSAREWADGPLNASVYNHFVLDRAECLVELGRQEEAEAILRDVESEFLTARLRSGLARCRSLLAVGSGDGAQAVRLAQEACAVLLDRELPFELARAQLVLGRIQRRLKAKRAAHDALTEALAGFTALGAASWAGQAREEMARIGLRPRAPRELTEIEALVADLAARGMTNREIAGSVFLTPKTVEAVLSRVYRKLGIRSRAELGRMLPERD